MRESIGPHRSFDEYEIVALAVDGRLDQAKMLLDASTMLQADEKRRFHLMLAALTRDEGRIDALYEAVAADPGFDLSRQLIVAAWLGEKGQAAEIAQRIDAALLGHMGLLWATEYCFCGSPFPLEATPNFARRLQEAKLRWPPHSPLRFPAKSW
jgi:hypothetical protein